MSPTASTPTQFTAPTLLKPLLRKSLSSSPQVTFTAAKPLPACDIHRANDMNSDESINLLGLDTAALTDLVAQWGGKPFRAKQLQRWLHQRGADSFDEMTDLAREFRQQLTEHRSEEHTSELQSLMRNSYAVFCLKKKT